MEQAYKIKDVTKLLFERYLNQFQLSEDLKRLSHKAIEEIENYPIDKLSRWLGFIQGYVVFTNQTTKEVKVCRGYVGFVKKYGLIAGIASNYPHVVPYWQPLLNEIKDDELDQILSLDQLKEKHKGLRENIYLGN